MATKTINYTPEQEQELLSLWDNGKGSSIESIAEATGRKARSIIAKLSKLGVYKAKQKNNQPVIRKNDLASQISEFVISAGFELTESDADSLGKANKDALIAILGSLQLQGSNDTDGVDTNPGLTD